MEIRIKISSSGRPESIEISEKKPAKKKSAVAELGEMLKPIMSEGQK